MRLYPFRACLYFEVPTRSVSTPLGGASFVGSCVRPLGCTPLPSAGQAVAGATIRVVICSCSYANREIGNPQGRNLEDYAQHGDRVACIASSKGDAPRYEIVPVPGVSGKGLFNNMRYKRNTVRSSLQTRTSGGRQSIDWQPART